MSSRATDASAYSSLIIQGRSQLVRAMKSWLQVADMPRYFSEDVRITASVLGPMQCMLKVCAQCLQWQVDPETGQRTKAVYSCSWQQQPLDIIAIDHLESRNNGVFNVVPTLNQLWLARDKDIV